MIIKITDFGSLEENLSDRIRDRMKTRNQTMALFLNDKQEIVIDGYIDLYVNSVQGGYVEGLGGGPQSY